MKLPYPALIRQLSGRSAIIEPGDGEMTIPPVLQPVYEMSSPLVRLSSIGALPANIQDSFIENFSYATSGVGIFASTAFPTLKSGRWQVTFVCSFSFSGTASIANYSALRIFDYLGNGKEIVRFPHAQNAVYTHDFSMPLLMTEDGWYFDVTRGVTVALDVLALAVTMHARRIF